MEVDVSLDKLDPDKVGRHTDISASKFEMLHESDTFRFKMMGPRAIPKAFRIEARDIVLKNYFDMLD